MNYKKVFIRLLKDFGCYQPYIRNFKVERRYIEKFNKVCDKSLDHFIELSLEFRKNQPIEDTFYYFLNDAFGWDRTDEGFGYWSDISHKLKCVGNCLYNEPAFNKEDIYSKKEIKVLQKILYEEERT